jgi:hypothetical protein
MRWGLAASWQWRPVAPRPRRPGPRRSLAVTGRATRSLALTSQVTHFLPRRSLVVTGRATRSLALTSQVTHFLPRRSLVVTGRATRSLALTSQVTYSLPRRSLAATGRATRSLAAASPHPSRSVAAQGRVSRDHAMGCDWARRKHTPRHPCPRHSPARRRHPQTQEACAMPQPQPRSPPGPVRPRPCQPDPDPHPHPDPGPGLQPGPGRGPAQPAWQTAPRGLRGPAVAAYVCNGDAITMGCPAASAARHSAAYFTLAPVLGAPTYVDAAAGRVSSFVGMVRPNSSTRGLVSGHHGKCGWRVRKGI